MHIPVLAEPALEWLRVREDGVYVDCTVGGGGHSALIAARLTTGRLIGLDRDPTAVETARARLSPFGCATVLHGNYGDLAAVLGGLGIRAVQGVLLDAGISAMQLEDPFRGFSFQQEGPLDMRMDPNRGPTAAEFLASIDEEGLAGVLKRYGDLRGARRIAAAILRRRQRSGLATTRDLVEAVSEAFPFLRGRPEETRTVFQAVRIAVNDELRWLEAGTTQAIDVLAPEGRLVAISFHSGEDRIVKRILRDASRPRIERLPDGRTVREARPRLRLLTPKPVRPSPEEVHANPRATSASLRAAERLADEGDAA